MAPLSIIPGRIRLESSELTGKVHSCMALRNRVNAVKGVIKTDINPRTGRILITFDDFYINSDDLITKVKEFLDEMKDESSARIYCNMPLELQDKNNTGAGSALFHAAIDIAGHALLPKPWGVLLLVAINAMRKKSVQS